MNYIYKTACLLIFILSFHLTQAQTFFKNNSLGVQFHYGSFLTHSSKADYVKDSYSYIGEVYTLQQTYFNQKGMHQIIPWGYGIFWGHTGSKQYMGWMGGAFAYTPVPIISFRRFFSNLRVGAGLGWVQKPYDKITNHKNMLIGTHLNGYINFLWQNEMRLTKYWLLNAGISFSHLSNGGSTLPNLGLNIPALSLGIRYSGAIKHFNPKPLLDSFHKKTSITLFTSAGVKQRPWIGSQRYVVTIVQAEITKQFSYNNQWGGGAVLFYDRSLQVDPSTITSIKRKGSLLQAGVYFSYEHTIGKFSIPVQVGGYIFNKYEFSTLFQQMGFRYHISPHWSSEVLLKTHAGKADVIHAGIGFTL